MEQTKTERSVWKILTFSAQTRNRKKLDDGNGTIFNILNTLTKKKIFLTWKTKKYGICSIPSFSKAGCSVSIY